MMAEWILDLDEPFYGEPFRARSHTWPLPPTSLSIKTDDEVTLPDSNNNDNIVLSGGEVSSGENESNGNSSSSASGQKKNSSRRNAWGNMSYADLITQAIQSSSEKRLTLSQIYDWMVQNVPYFKDKGDSNSSAGWKNSIRHNLSLHNRFRRVQNEGTGKSSWWVINPEAKPGKAARRRATSMETQKYEKKRGRVKTKVEALRNGTIFDDKPSPVSSLSEGLDMFQLSPDFRPRASSNASSCGRLSPVITESGSTLSLSSLGATTSQVMGHIMPFNNQLPNDLDLTMESLQGMECDVDQIIKHELSVEGNLDFKNDCQSFLNKISLHTKF